MDRYKIDETSSVPYSTVISKESISIMINIAALNGFYLKGAGVNNSLNTSPNKEKVWMDSGKDFGNMEGKMFIVLHNLYRLKRSFSTCPIPTMNWTGNCVLISWWSIEWEPVRSAYSGHTGSGSR